MAHMASIMWPFWSWGLKAPALLRLPCLGCHPEPRIITGKEKKRCRFCLRVGVNDNMEAEVITNVILRYVRGETIAV